MSLLAALGWLDGPGVTIEAPRPATLSELLTVHSYPYVQAVQKAQAIARGAQPPADLTFYGLGTADDPLFADMHDAAALYTGATIQAMQALLEGRAVHAFSPAGGHHHAHKALASGFCIYNDCAAAIALAVASGRRVAYLDFDAHHGDGVQAAFYDDPRVLTVSVHESGEYLFPGTGSDDETGRGAGAGTSVNIPLPPHAATTPYSRAFDRGRRPGGAGLRTRPPAGADRSGHSPRRPPDRPRRDHGPLPTAGATSARPGSRMLRWTHVRGRRRWLRPGGRDPPSLDGLPRDAARPRRR